MILNKKAPPSLTELKEEFPQLEGVLFDLDGTLVDSEKAHAQALEATLIEVTGRKVFTYKEVMELYLGLPDNTIFDDFIEKEIIKDISLKVFIDIKNKYLIRSLSTLDMHAGLKRLISQLKAEKIPFAVVTASERSTAIFSLTKIGLINDIQFLIAREDCKKSKPNPLPYITGIKKLGINNDHIAVFEDSEVGIEAAIKAKVGLIIKVEWY